MLEVKSTSPLLKTNYVQLAQEAQQQTVQEQQTQDTDATSSQNTKSDLQKAITEFQKETKKTLYLYPKQQPKCSDTELQTREGLVTIHVEGGKTTYKIDASQKNPSSPIKGLDDAKTFYSKIIGIDK